MSIETNAKNSEQIQKIFKDIENLNVILNPEHPRYHEYAEILAKAKSTYERATVASSSIGGGPIIDTAFETLKDLYRSAMEIRASMLPSSIAQAIKVQPRETIESTLMNLIDPITDTRLISSDAKKLGDMARGLAVNPADVLSGGNVPGNRYYKKSNVEIVVQLATVHEDEKLLADLKRDVLPGLSALEPIIRKLEAGLQLLRAYNPVRTQMFDWAVNFENTKNKMDTKPLRLLGVLAGGLLSGVGLAVNLITGSPVTWPTFAWAGVAAYSLYPDFMAGNGGKERAFVAQFTEPKMRDLMRNFNAEALEDLQIIRRNPATRKLIAEFAQSKTPLSAAQIGALTDGKDTPLTKALSALNAKGMAQDALQTFGQRLYSRNETETLKMLMKA